MEIYPFNDFATRMHLVQHCRRLSSQTVQFLVQIRLTDGQQPHVPETNNQGNEWMIVQLKSILKNAPD